MSLTISKRGLLSDEAKTLTSEVKNTPNITGYSLKEWLSFDNVRVAELDGKFAGACVIKKRTRRWSEIAVLIVLSDYRGKGLGIALAKNAYVELTKNRQNIFASSRNPKIINLLKEQNFVFCLFGDYQKIS